MHSIHRTIPYLLLFACAAILASGPVEGQGDNRTQIVRKQLPAAITSGHKQAFIPASLVPGACADERVRQAVEIHIEKWRPKTEARKIARDLNYFRALAKCAPGVRDFRIAGPREQMACKFRLENARKFNKSYGRALRRIFPRTAVFYDAATRRGCYPRRTPPGYITPAVVRTTNWDDPIFAAVPKKHCPKSVRGSSIAIINLGRMESDPAHWDRRQKKAYQRLLARDLLKLTSLKHCPRLQLAKIYIAIWLFLEPGRSRSNRDDEDNERAFRKKHGPWLRKNLPDKVIVIDSFIW